MEKGRVRCPKYIDSPITFLFWDIDIFMPALLLFATGIFTKNVVNCTLLMVAYIVIISKYQKKFPKGVARNFLHYIGFPYKGYPDGYVRVLRG